jgi:hypothetical protein
MDASLSEALKEAYALAPSNVATLETLEFSHPALPGGSIFLVKDFAPHDFLLEDGSTLQTFQPCGFSVQRPQTGQNGAQQMSIVVDNVNQVITDFINKIKSSSSKVTVTYRPYLSNDLHCQMIPPLQLWMTDVTVSETQVAANCVFLDIINMPFPNDFYTRDRFPGLANTLTQ